MMLYRVMFAAQTLTGMLLMGLAMVDSPLEVLLNIGSMSLPKTTRHGKGVIWMLGPRQLWMVTIVT